MKSKRNKEKKGKWSIRVAALGRMPLLVVAALIVFSGNTLAVKPPGVGNGGGGGNVEIDVPDYGDLIKLYRDADGVPYVTPYDADTMTGMCQQPLPSAECPELCKVAGYDVAENLAVEVVDVDQTTCAIEIDCAICAQEVEFGRMNEVRSSDEVFAAQLDDVVVKLATADCVSLDPAGRLVANTLADDGVTVLTSTIDSPLQSLAIYRQLMLKGYLGDETKPIPLSIDTAARALGTAADKGGEVNVDMWAYLNQIMGLTDLATPTVLGKKCINVREEVMGTVQEVEKCFLDLGNVPGHGRYDYDRRANFEVLPDPAYIPAGSPADGWFEILVPTSEPETFVIARGPILDYVFTGDPDFTDDGVGGFVQQADDTRAVINYMHSWPVPADYETAVPLGCEPGPDDGFDVSISEESGLQVPVQMIANTEGREFTVTVSNAGPDHASGSVTVTAETGDGSGPVLVGGIPGPFVFEFDNLAPGMGVSSTELFILDTPHVQTTITWTATVEAPGDVLLNNNSVTATTNVRVTGGGGGGNH